MRKSSHMNCLACGATKDPSVAERYPYSGPFDDLDTTEPIQPLLTVACQPHEPGRSYRQAVLCHECWHRLCVQRHGIDLRISQACWESIYPLTPFADLPSCPS